MGAAARRSPSGTRDFKSRRAGPAKFSGWMGLGCGLTLGLGIAVIVYLKDHRLEPAAGMEMPGAETSGIEAPAVPSPGMTAIGTSRPKRKLRTNEPPDSADAPGAEPAKSYDFYDALPKFEMVVPERDKEVRPDIKSIAETRKGTYVLQVGSYKNFADADRVRAKLALQGVQSSVQKVSIDNDTWHRIRIGPISKLDELNRLRAILHKADVDALVIRVGD